MRCTCSGSSSRFLALVVLFFSSGIPVQMAWQITRVTNNSTDDSTLVMGVNGANLVWHDSANHIIYYYNGSTIQTVYSGYHSNYDIDGTTVVYVGWDGSDYEVYKWIGGTTTQLTNDSYSQQLAHISGSNIVWETNFGADWEIVLNGTRITNNAWPDTWNQISGNYIVWDALETSSGGLYNYVRMWDGSTIRTLSNPTDMITSWGLDVSGSRAVWIAKYETATGEVAYYNGSSTTRLTNNAVQELSVGISGANAVWIAAGGSDGGTDTEVFLYNGSATQQLTVDNDSEDSPCVSGSWVAYHKYSSTSGLHGVYVWDGVTTTEVTSTTSAISNVCLSGSTVAWVQNDGDNEIFEAIAILPTATPAPTNTATPSYTATFSPTVTYTPTRSPTISPTQTSTLTASATSSATLTPTRTNSPTASPTLTASSTASLTPTNPPTFTPSLSATLTLTATASATVSPTRTPTLTPSLSATPSLTATASATVSPTNTNTLTSSPSPTETATATSTPSATPAITPTPTVTPLLVIPAMNLSGLAAAALLLGYCLLKRR